MRGHISPMAEQDSVPIAVPASAMTRTDIGPGNWKLMLSIFLSFILVVSNPFTNGIVAGFGKKAVIGRTVTAYGVAVQATCMVVMYALTVYLLKNDIL